MRKYLFLLSILPWSYLSGHAQSLSQTRTATRLNNFQGLYVDNYLKADAEDVAADDGIYAYTKKLSANGTWYASLALQGFGFTIPDDATIQNVIVKVRRFKKGKPSIKDYFVSSMQNYSTMYGVSWTNLDNYPGNYYPEAESEFTFSQTGSGNNGGFYHDQAYQWTPAMINHPYFGVRIDVYPPSGSGTVVVYYDLVEITVDYSLPEVVGRKSPGGIEITPSKDPIVFPNPFTTKTKIQFTAAESGKAVVELYNITGVKVRTLFSGVVVEGNAYNVTAGDAMLSKGAYVYMISNGKQKYTGRIIKLE